MRKLKKQIKLKRKENSLNEIILKQYEVLIPINLVDNMEHYYHTFLLNQSEENLNIFIFI